MRSMSCFAKNFETISCPKVKETPLSFSPQPVTSLSGSDQRRSQSKPVEDWVRGRRKVRGEKGGQEEGERR